MLPIHTEHLTIRPFERADAPFILRLLNEPSFIEHIADKGVRTLEAAAAYLEQGPMASYLSHGHGLWMVQEQGTGAPMGMCGLIKRDSLAEVDLGYAFVPEYWGKGYAREAAAACLAYGRDRLGLQGLLAIVSPGNARSVHLLLTLGFVLQGPLELAPGDEVALYRLALAGAVAPAPHPLDNPIWSALTTRHRNLAEGQGPARRYPPEVAPFAGLRDFSAASFEALGLLSSLEDPIALVLPKEVPLPDRFTVQLARAIDQMVGGALPGAVTGPDLVPLGVADEPEMMALVALTRPGPFAPRTREMGTYLGIRCGNRLVAMAGERMCLDGFTEISAVCTHPDHRGRGYARALITALVQGVTARGEVPFLHVVGENEAAIGLYRQLGFTRRRTVHFTVLRRT
jgi:RimJ/RimL family protein N-acetyltransferase